MTSRAKRMLSPANVCKPWRQRGSIEPRLTSNMGSEFLEALNSREAVCIRGLGFLGVTGQQLVQVIGEGFSVALAECGRPTGLDTAGTQGIHEIPHIESRTDGGGGVQLTPWVESKTAFLQHFCCQWDITGDDKITGTESSHNLVVGHIKATGNLHGADIAGRWYAYRLVRYQSQFDLGALGGTEQDFLDDDGTGVSVYPYFHGIPRG